MDKIGIRIAQAIRERAHQSGTKFYEERRKLDISAQNIYNWTKGGFLPTAYYLREMALAGYDVHWILTGRKHED